MTFEEYAAQQAQEAQNTPQTQNPLDAQAAQLDAEKLYSLMAEAREAIADRMNPAALLTMLTGAMFGATSTEAAAVAEIIDADRHPGGHELAIADLRQQRHLLRQQAKQLEAQARAITGELERLDAAERALTGERTDGANLDRALLDVLTFRKQLDRPQGDILKAIAKLCDQHGDEPAAMGLLYGTLTDLARRQYSEQKLDLAQQREYEALRKRVEGLMQW